MLEKDLEEVEAIYTYIDEQPHLAAWLASVDETPVGMVQTYDPFVDEIEVFYDRREGDLGNDSSIELLARLGATLGGRDAGQDGALRLPGLAGAQRASLTDLLLTGGTSPYAGSRTRYFPRGRSTRFTSRGPVVITSTTVRHLRRLRTCTTHS